MVNTRLSSLSINQDEFNKAKPLHEKALKNSSFNKNIKFESIQEKPSRNRKRKDIWLHPPYNAEVKQTSVKYF